VHADEAERAAQEQQDEEIAFHRSSDRLLAPSLKRASATAGPHSRNRTNSLKSLDLSADACRAPRS
jgi:hypothetical protein